MKLGIITSYNKNYDSYGIKVLNVFPEIIEKNHITGKYKYYPTQYYVKCNDKLWFVEACRINTEIAKRQYNCKIAIVIFNNLLIKFNAG